MTKRRKNTSHSARKRTKPLSEGAQIDKLASLLNAISENKGKSQSNIIILTERSWLSATDAIRALEEKGLVHSTKHGREKQLRLTSTGERVKDALLLTMELVFGTKPVTRRKDLWETVPRTAVTNEPTKDNNSVIATTKKGDKTT